MISFRSISHLIKKSAPVLGALSLLGCVTEGDIQTIHSHIADVDTKVDKLTKSSSSKEEVARLDESLSQNASAILKSNAEIGRRFAELTSELQSLAGKLESANRRLADLSQQLADVQPRSQAPQTPQTQTAPGAAGSDSPPSPGTVPTGPTPAATAKPVPKGPTPSDLYRQATGDYQRGQFDLARDGFQEYVATYPKTDLSDDAAYWIAECWLAQKKPREAIGALDTLIKNYPQSDKMAASILKKGLAHMELGEKAQGITQLQQVVHRFPGTDEAKIARQRLKSLGTEPR